MSVYGKVITPDGEGHEVWGGIYLHRGSAYVEGSDRILGYWETELEIFMWACEAIGEDPYKCEWLRPTGEVVNLYDISEEEALIYNDECA